MRIRSYLLLLELCILTSRDDGYRPAIAPTTSPITYHKAILLALANPLPFITVRIASMDKIPLSTMSETPGKLGYHLMAVDSSESLQSPSVTRTSPYLPHCGSKSPEISYVAHKSYLCSKCLGATQGQSNLYNKLRTSLYLRSMPLKGAFKFQEARC